MGEQRQSHGDGIYSRWSRRRKARTYYVQYHWHDPELGQARRITETVPPDKDGKTRLKSAQRFKAKREKAKHAPDFKPEHIEEREARERRHTEADKRAPLLYERAVTAFFAECISEYARPAAVKAALGLEPGVRTKRPSPVAEAFRGRYLDQISRVDIRQYFLDRVQNSGPFEGRDKPVTRRAPEQEITFLSALYTFMQDAGHALENPCHRPRTRRRDSPLAPYRPRHEAVIPSDRALVALMQATLRAKVRRPAGADPAEDLRTGPHLIDDFDRTLVALTYYTAARPESEPCRLLHGDVTLAEGDRWGAVTYRRTKTGEPRRILLHPEAERCLRTILLPVPIGKAERQRWARLPVFRRRGSIKPWDKSSYCKSWSNIRRAVSPQFPEVAGMWLRDLRKVAKTRMIDAGVSELAVNRILGHRDGVTGRYYQLTDEAMQRALDHLTLKFAAEFAAGQDGVMGSHSVLTAAEVPRTRTLAAT